MIATRRTCAPTSMWPPLWLARMPRRFEIGTKPGQDAALHRPTGNPSDPNPYRSSLRAPPVSPHQLWGAAGITRRSQGDGEGVAAGAAGWRVGPDRPPPGAGFGADQRAHHHRLLRIPDRTGHPAVRAHLGAVAVPARSAPVHLQPPGR